MKLRLNKRNLALLPVPVRTVVEEWRAQYRKSTISVRNVTSFYIEEDATYIAFSPDMQKRVSVRAGGEWAGVTNLMPGSNCPLPGGCTVIAKGFFCGHAWLTISHNDAQSMASGLTTSQTPALTA